MYSHLCTYASFYLYSYPSTHGISRPAAGGAWEKFEVRLKITIKWTQMYTPRPWSSEYGDAYGGSNRAYLEVHLEATIGWTWRFTPRLSSSKFGNALGDHDCANMEAAMEWSWTYTWRPWSRKFGDALWGCDCARLEMHCGGHDCANLQAVMERFWRYPWRSWSSEFVDTLGGHDQATLDEYLEAVDRGHTRCWVSMHQLVNLRPWECDKATVPLSSHGELAYGGQSCREAPLKWKLHSEVNL